MNPKFLLLSLVLTSLTAPSNAAPILPAGQFPELDSSIQRHERQFYGFNALPFGVSLDAHVASPEDRGLIDQFLAQTESDDVKAVTGKHPFEMMTSYGEHGDLGFFGGIALAGTAHRYLALKAEGAAAEVLAQARERLVRAAESWHVCYVVTGGNGLVARGIGRMVPENPDDPPIPGVNVPLVPLFDEEGNPFPDPKTNGEWREELSDGVLPAGTWTWIDSASKDQLSGQVFAMVALYDAMKDDPDIDQGLVVRIQEDALGVARMLMKDRLIDELSGLGGSGTYDLIIMDADGRPTMYHDLNPLSLEKVYVPQGSAIYNLFNMVLAQGVLKGLYHITGDPEVEAYLYKELYADRGWLNKIADWRSSDCFDYIYAGVNTNFDDPDMTSIGLFLGIYLENDPEVLSVLLSFLEESWWNREGESHTAKLCKQPLWHSIYLAVTDRGIDPALVAEYADLMMGFNLGPYWNDRRENCDADELASGSCLAEDGTTVLTLERVDGNNAMATEALHPSIRPPSDFNARSNPFDVNGGGGLMLNPGGDLLASYWLLRHLQSRSPGASARSPFARIHMGVGGGPSQYIPVESDQDVVAADSQGDDDAVSPDADSSKPDNSGCTTRPTSSGSLLPLLAVLVMVLATRRWLSNRTGRGRSHT